MPGESFSLDRDCWKLWRFYQALIQIEKCDKLKMKQSLTGEND